MSDSELRNIIKDEYEKCLKDPIYFAKQYCMIQHPKRGRIKFSLYKFQEKTLKQFLLHRHVIILKSRQLGISTLSAGYALWMALFHNDKEILVVATKQDTAKKIVTKVRVMYDNLPTWLKKQETTEENNKLSIRFSNGSQIVAAGSTSDVGRSAANSLVIIDEAAFIQGFDEKWASIQQTLATGGDIIVLSTPNGMGNFFHTTWVDGLDGENPFYPIRLHWSVHPDRDQSWRDDQDKLLGKRFASQECDCDFVSSGNTVITGDILKWYELQIKEPLEKQGVDNNYWIWEYPSYDISRNYIVVADVARGDGSDYSSFHVFDLEKMTQVAEYRGKPGTKDFGNMLVNVATSYNEALLVIENANIGWAAIQPAIDREYKNLFYSLKQDSRVVDAEDYLLKKYDMKDKKDMVAGFTTSIRTRPMIISQMELYMREKAVDIYSQRLWNELSVFIWNKTGKPEAQGGYNDDLVMAFAIGVWVRDTALKLRTEGMNLNRQALNTLGNSISSGIYTSTENQSHPTWNYKVGKHNIDLTKWI